AHAQIGTALRGDLELQALGAGRLDRQAYAHLLAISCLPAEEFVLVDLPLRKPGLPQCHRRGLGCEAEALAVEVVAIGYGVMHLYRGGVERPRRKAERLVGLEQF